MGVSANRKMSLGEIRRKINAGALTEAGDLVQPMQRGVIAQEHVLGELAQLVRGEVAGRMSDQDITLFKSVGTALEDLAAAQMVLASRR